MAYTFDLAEFNFEFVNDSMLVFGELDLNKECDEAECDGVFAVSHEFRGFRHEGLDLAFEGGEVFDYVFGENFVGYDDVAHVCSPMVH